MPCIGQLGARGALLLAVVAVCVSSVCAEASPDSIVAEPVAWHADGIVPERDPLAEVNARAAKEDALLSPLEEFESQEEEDDVFGAQAQLEALIESAVSNTAQDEPEPAAAGSAAGSADPFAEAQHKLEDDEKEGAQKFHEWSNKMHAAVQDANQAQDGLSKAAPGWDTDAVTDNLAKDAEITDHATHNLYAEAQKTMESATKNVNQATSIAKSVEAAVGSADAQAAAEQVESPSDTDAMAAGSAAGASLLQEDRWHHLFNNLEIDGEVLWR